MKRDFTIAVVEKFFWPDPPILWLPGLSHQSSHHWLLELHPPMWSCGTSFWKGSEQLLGHCPETETSENIVLLQEKNAHFTLLCSICHRKRGFIISVEKRLLHSRKKMEIIICFSRKCSYIFLCFCLWSPMGLQTIPKHVNTIIITTKILNVGLLYL